MAFFKKGKSARTIEVATPTTPAAAATPDTPKKGLDKFMEIMEAAKRAKEESAKGSTATPSPFTAGALLSQENLAKLVESADFSKAISQDVATRIAQQDPTAILEAIQATAKQAYGLALQQAGMLSDATVQSGTASLQELLDSQIQSRLQDSKFQEAIAPSKNPVVNTAIRQLLEDARAADPNMTPEEAAELTKEFIATLNDEFNGPVDKHEASDDPDQTNWLEFASTP